MWIGLDPIDARKTAVQAEIESSAPGRDRRHFGAIHQSSLRFRRLLGDDLVVRLSQLDAEAQDKFVSESRIVAHPLEEWTNGDDLRLAIARRTRGRAVRPVLDGRHLAEELTFRHVTEDNRFTIQQP